MHYLLNDLMKLPLRERLLVIETAISNCPAGELPSVLADEYFRRIIPDRNPAEQQSVWHPA